ncbi:MAG: peptidylprolyl isomerase [Bacteroidetes bacterium]|nr:MAG: peptidylprolyl isomerase [Bacteroidota bacterium]RLD82999.1 MAG: peptidylprolyl isomerase [Bacteroidota bacterium]
MATLENIRKRGPLVAIIIGFALLAFILGDLLNSGSNLFGGDRFSIAQIDDVTVDYREYEQRVLEATERYKLQRGIRSVDDREREEIKRQVWEELVDGIILNTQFEEIGLTVSSDELFDLVQGKNIDSEIMQIPAFQNQQTGIFDPSLVVYFLKSMEKDESGQSKTQWLALESQINKKRLSSKYINLVLKGMYVTKSQSVTSFKERNYLVDFNYVAKKYSEVSDSSITVTNKDIKTYYKDHENDFEQEASRDIAYVTFDIFPSKKDSAYALDWINKSISDFKTVEDNKQFVNFNSDVPFIDQHFKKGELTNLELDSLLFIAEINDIVGPYYEDGSYKLAKLIEIKDMPDSIKARHILIQPDGKKILDLNQAKEVADSLKNLIINGADFAELVKNFSTDQTTLEKAGELGWFEETEQALPFAVFPYKELEAEKTNDFKIVETNYGIHLIAKTDQGESFKKVQAAILERKVVPSSETYQMIYAEASKFAGENREYNTFEESLGQLSLIKKVAPGLTKNETFVSGLQSPREMIRWAFKAEKGEVSQVFEFGNRYVVAALTTIREKGTAPLEQVQEEIKIYVSKDKKAEYLISEMSKLSAGDLNSIASKLNVNVEEARNVSFSSFSIPGLGFEPAVIAEAVNSEKNKIAGPIKGENGVFLIEVSIITPAMEVAEVDLKPEIKRLAGDLRNRAIYQVINALKESTEIVDERSKFY